jgi:hypothetical protein
LAAASGNKIFFAGGSTSTTTSNALDIYDVTSGQWSTDTLPSPAAYYCAVAAGNLILFPRNIDSIDIYNATTGSWSFRSTEQEAVFFAGVATGNLVLFSCEYGSEPAIAELYRLQ